MSTYRQTLERAFFITLVVAATLSLAWMVRDFLYPVFWAIVFALLLSPVYNWTHARLRSGSVAALLVIVVASVMVLVPVSLLGAVISQETQDAYTYISNSNFAERIPANPQVQSVLGTVGISVSDITNEATSMVRNASAWVVGQTIALSGRALSIGLQTLLMMYLLFFFLRDGEKIVKDIEGRLPLSVVRTRAMLSRFAATVRGTLKGAVIIAIAQGVFGGLLFWIAGVPSPVLLGALIAFFAFLPIVGPFLIWIPVSILLVISGAYLPALFVALGSLTINIVLDDIVRPMLVGKTANLPAALTIIAIFGGIASFGIPGIIIGPVVAAFALSCWDLFAAEYQKTT